MTIQLIFQLEWTRLFNILISQSFIILIFAIIIYKVLARRTDRATLFLSGFYITISTGLIFNITFISLLLGNVTTNSILYPIYYLSSFLTIFAFIFIVIFLIHIYNIQSVFSIKKSLIIIISYAIICFLVLVFPAGITINEANNWTPIYSWEFLIFLYIIFSFIIFMPTLIYSYKLLKMIQAPSLRKKLKQLIMGVIGLSVLFYGVILYNTWHNPLFRVVWSLLTFIFIIPSSIFIYYGIAQNL
ncbi:MAG: hypothetical protein EU541_08510 [Promethearchaeota archaeon]|nr:MAG: hypothetical protein EU541_08510 [Candidatus Lokiarchaeota archaeon]